MTYTFIKIITKNSEIYRVTRYKLISNSSISAKKNKKGQINFLMNS